MDALGSQGMLENLDWWELMRGNLWSFLHSRCRSEGLSSRVSLYWALLNYPGFFFLLKLSTVLTAPKPVLTGGLQLTATGKTEKWEKGTVRRWEHIWHIYPLSAPCRALPKPDCSSDCLAAFDDQIQEMARGPSVLPNNFTPSFAPGLRCLSGHVDAVLKWAS